MFFDGKSFIKFFFLGNIAGAILFLFFSFLTGETFVFLSGAVLGVYSSIFAIISYNPKMQVILFPLPFRLPLYAFGLILLALDTFSTVGQGQITGLFIARLGAAGFGYFYMKSFQQGNDFLGRWIPDFSNNSKISSVFKKKPKSRLNVKKSGYQQKKEYTRPQTDEEFSINKIAKQKQIDKILDKISKSGYDSLTKEEKDFLFNSSK
jgi:hypothetical protein